MRLLILALLTVALAACAPETADVPETDAATPPPSPEAPSSSLRIDSLLRDEPDLRYTVRIGYPQIGSDAPAIEVLNAAIRDSVEALADDFRPAEPPPEYYSPTTVVDVEGGTERTFLGDGVFSALVEVYAHTGGAHGNTFFLPLTFDLETGKPIAPADLFADGTAWGDTLADWTERGVLRQLSAMADGDARQSFFAEGLDPIREGDVLATLGPDSLHVHIPPYQLSAYAAGSFDVGVPYSALARFARPGSALARLADE